MSFPTKTPAPLVCPSGQGTTPRRRAPEHYNLWLHPGLKNIHDLKELARLFAQSVSFSARFSAVKDIISN
jgi:hypothetical protein